MELCVLDKNFNKLFILANYSYAQYTREFNKIGSFQVQTIIDKNTPLLHQQGYYILFDTKACGIIQGINPIVDNKTKESTLTIEGYLSKGLLTRRCIPKSTSMYGTAAQFALQVVDENCVNTEPSRVLPIVLNEDYPAGDYSDRQVTGGEVEGAVQEILDTENLGHDLSPILTDTSLLGFNFTILKGSDRTIGNSENHAPIVCSTDLKNILSGSYSYNTKNYKNTAYVAGEGEGSSRTVRIVNDDNTGIDRCELYVDARDLQSTDEQGTTLTPAQYASVLDNRGLEKLKEYMIAESYEATVAMTDERYIYGRDFFLGDLITLEDRLLGIRIDSRLVAVQISETKAETKIDLTFGNSYTRISEKLRRKGVI